MYWIFTIGVIRRIMTGIYTFGHLPGAAGGRPNKEAPGADDTGTSPTTEGAREPGERRKEDTEIAFRAPSTTSPSNRLPMKGRWRY